MKHILNAHNEESSAGQFRTAATNLEHSKIALHNKIHDFSLKATCQDTYQMAQVTTTHRKYETGCY